MLSFGLLPCAQGRSMLRPCKRATCFAEIEPAKRFPPAICPPGQSLSGSEQKLQRFPPRLSRETFGGSCVCTPLCLYNPHLPSYCIDIYVFIFPSPAIPGKGGFAKPIRLSSPGLRHSALFFCCLSRLLPVTAVNHLSSFLQNFTDMGQERKPAL